MKNLVAWSAAAALVCSTAFILSARAEDAPKYKIKDVMQKAMKGGLQKKVADGKGTDAEKKELVEMFTALAAHKAPKGDEASWKEFTSSLVTAAKEVQDGKEGGGAKLLKSANCMGCHKAHRPA